MGGRVPPHLAFATRHDFPYVRVCLQGSVLWIDDLEISPQRAFVPIGFTRDKKFDPHATIVDRRIGNLFHSAAPFACRKPLLDMRSTLFRVMRHVHLCGLQLVSLHTEKEEECVGSSHLPLRWCFSFKLK